jgi:hypothetical protein
MRDRVIVWGVIVLLAGGAPLPGGQPPKDSAKPAKATPPGGTENGPVKKIDGSVVYPLPTRDPAPLVAGIDREWRRALDRAGVEPAAEADDAEFLRRATLDLTGRVPSWQRARAFLDDRDPDKRRKLVDELLAGPEYGRHAAAVWRDLLAPPDDSAKPRPDTLSPWLAEQFNRNRGWDAIVRDLLTAEGPVQRTPQLGFVLAHADGLHPRPELLADATARLFLGVSLQCAQCHDHPFARWKQADFWGLAAFFSHVRPDSPKGGPNLAIIEGEPLPQAGREPPRGAALLVPGEKGPAAGKVVRARFPGGAELGEDVAEPFRPRLADWLTARDNPYFARNAVNRLWARLFGRGLVEPLDGLGGDNSPANPALLDLLAREFADSGYDLKHLIRGLCLSRAYQRTSRAGGDAGEEGLFARMAVKPLRPEVLFDSLAATLHGGPADKKAGPKTPGVKNRDPLEGREAFVRLFRARGGNDDGAAHPGTPQVLHLLNGPLLNDGGALVGRLADGDADRERAVETLFLAAYARRPTPGEVELVGRYLDKQPSARAGYAGVLWALLNSSEFLLNH